MEFDEIVDDYVEEGSDREVEEDESEENLLFLKTLISVVKANPALYAKNKKQYSGKNFNKSLAWQSLGQSLSPPMRGEDAEKTFYKLRQKFGKELRKHKNSVRGRSGSGRVPQYIPKWPLFNDLMFLSDHIAARRTTSNYVVKSKDTTSAPSSSAPIINWTTDFLMSPEGESDLSSQASTSRPSSACRLSMGSISSPSVTESMSRSPSPFLAPASPASPSLPTSQSVSATAKVLQAMNSALGPAPKRKAPEPDTFAQKKKKLEENFMNSMMESNKTVAAVADKLLSGNASASAPAAPPDPILSAIQVALDKVPSEKKFSCMMRVLNVIQNEFFEM